MAVARFFCEKSERGFWADVQTSRPEIVAATGLSEDDVADALYELRNFMKRESSAIMADGTLYAEFDKYFFERDPAADALVIATALQNDSTFPEKAVEIAERLQWSPRRLNPALAYLVDRKIVRDTLFISGGPFVATKIARTDATRRFVKSRL